MGLARKFCSTKANRSREGYPEARCIQMRRLVSRRRASIFKSLSRKVLTYLGRGQLRAPEVAPQQPKQAVGGGVEH